ncbi:uncharacterized protein BJ212DRAFT_1301017 [Suillus subaureus]|uniref:DUF6532 domain-containing protein n=1 Tax=Suillus subaureus TaxID=48587 RepID=A0A9P7E876_9AGAM|nr:uncharacterized protein BJ212DRAFT_1301017 [Suillus subaureus]KAG1813637.1 hypothetical protein BJ212DRAFT_1301017 [Suillus subaureus]
MFSSGRFGFQKPASTSSQSIQKVTQSSNCTLEEAIGKVAESDTSDDDGDQGRIDSNDEQMDGVQQMPKDTSNITMFGQHEGNLSDEHENGTQDDLNPDNLNPDNFSLDNFNPGNDEDFNNQSNTPEKDFDGDSNDEAEDKTEESEVFDVLEHHQVKNGWRSPLKDTLCQSLLIGQIMQDYLFIHALIVLHLTNLIHTESIEMHYNLPKKSSTLNCEYTTRTRLYWIMYQTQMAWLLCDDLFTFRTQLKKVIVSIMKTSYGIFPKGTVACKEMQKCVTVNATKLLKTTLKDSCLEFYYSNSKKALKNTEEFQCSIPVNGLLLVAVMIKGVITGFHETSTDKVPDLSTDKCRANFNSLQESVDNLIGNPEHGKDLKEMLEEWAMIGMGDCYFDDDNVGGSDMEDVNVIL